MRGAAIFAAAGVIVEAHRHGQGTTGDLIATHFAGMHEVTIHRQRAKDAGDFDAFRNESQHARLLATWEGRDNENWLHLRPRTATAGGLRGPSPSS